MLKNKLKLIFILAIVPLFTTGAVAEDNNNFTKQLPQYSRLIKANELKFAQQLIKNGQLDAKVNQKEVEEKVDSYLHKKIESSLKTVKQIKDEEIAALSKSKSSFAEKLIDKNISLRSFNLKDKKYEKNIQDEEIYKPNVLVLLAEFSDDEYGKGPLHNNIPKPNKENNADFWVENFEAKHYENMLFGKTTYKAEDQNAKGLNLETMNQYFRQQSFNSMDISGKVYGWIKLPHSEAYYGDDETNGSIDSKLPGTYKDFARDVILAADKNNVPFEEFDQEDPNDLDNDNNLQEPDGIIDHLFIIHSGVDQAYGGGEQQDDALWSLSSENLVEIPSSNGNLAAYNFTTQAESSGIGTFCHEFTHDLGLPDEYDALYTSNGDPVGYYSLMSSGGWLGEPMGTMPSSISIWGRTMLGKKYGGKWIKPTELDSENLKVGKIFNIFGSLENMVGKRDGGMNTRAVKLNLPQKETAITKPISGNYDWYSNKGDDINHTLKTKIDLNSSQKAKLNFDIWYDIEQDYDYCYVQVSEDNANWVDIGKYTGKSPGWQNEEIDLANYVGKSVYLQFKFDTDGGLCFDGAFIDNIKISNEDDVLLNDGAEVENNLWQCVGWTRNNGTLISDHYYLLEWRNYNLTDESLKKIPYYYDYNKGILKFFNYEPGLLLWYKNDAYLNNCMAYHPGEAFLGIVDSHPQPMTTKDGIFFVSQSVQLCNAPFSTAQTTPKTIAFSEGNTYKFGSEAGQHLFDEANSYFCYLDENPNLYQWGLKTPKYGLKIKVINNSFNFTNGYVSITKN